MKPAVVIAIVSLLLIIVLVGGGAGAYFLTKEPQAAFSPKRSNDLIVAAKIAEDKKAALAQVVLEIDELTVLKTKANETDAPLIQGQLDKLNTLRLDLTTQVQVAEAKLATVKQAQEFADETKTRSDAAAASASAAKISADAAIELKKDQSDSQLLALVKACVDAANAAIAASNSALGEVSKSNAAVTAANVAQAQLAAGAALQFATVAAAKADLASDKLLEAQNRLTQVGAAQTALTNLLASHTTKADSIGQAGDQIQAAIQATINEAMIVNNNTDPQALAASNLAVSKCGEANVKRAQAMAQLVDARAAISSRDAQTASSKLQLAEQLLNDTITIHDQAKAAVQTMKTRLNSLGQTGTGTGTGSTGGTGTGTGSGSTITLNPPPSGKYIISSVNVPTGGLIVEGSTVAGNYMDLNTGCTASNSKCQLELVQIANTSPQEYYIMLSSSTTLGLSHKSIAADQSLQIALLNKTAPPATQRFVIQQVAAGEYLIRPSSSTTLALSGEAIGNRPRTRALGSVPTQAQKWKLLPQ